VMLSVRAAVNIPLILSTFIGVDLKVANATGTLTSLQCPSAGTANPSAMVGVSTQIATLVVGPFDPSEVATGEPLGDGALLTVLGGVVAKVTLNSKKIGPVNVGSTMSQPTGPYDTYTAVQGVSDPGSGATYVHQTAFTAVAPDNTDTVGTKAPLASTINSLLGTLTANNNLQVCVLAVICVGPLVDPILSALNGLLTPLASLLLDPLLESLMNLLGLQLGTATVTMSGAIIGQPVLVTTCLPVTGTPSAACPAGGG
ncbi:MAG: hypothetical protein ACHQIO_05090, partial [Nevskiales bacterium]